ncbi:unnamed protein product [Paramecium octaurelia]|uniref:Uncharacterized protein n=1 Tax=Paramecium octaurelia TaxID=43137 RepID=A0A8S1YNP4_PAROT|nr:unnamed protein product [Paramecium octaurelia]
MQQIQVRFQKSILKMLVLLMVFYCPQRKPKLNFQLISEILNSQSKGGTEIVFHSPKSVQFYLKILSPENFFHCYNCHFKVNPFYNAEIDRTIQRFCQNPILEASRACILKGVFLNY